jgi:hypothetical protein
MAKTYSEQRMYSNALVKKYRSKKEQTDMATSRNRQTSGDAMKKQMKDMFDRVKKSEADKRKKMSQRVK